MFLLWHSFVMRGALQYLKAGGTMPLEPSFGRSSKAATVEEKTLRADITALANQLAELQDSASYASYPVHWCHLDVQQHLDGKGTNALNSWRTTHCLGALQAGWPAM